jgi:hypothetical protein
MAWFGVLVATSALTLCFRSLSISSEVITLGGILTGSFLRGIGRFKRAPWPCG